MRIFLSHSRQDLEQVLALEQQLKWRGLGVWRDQNDLPLGAAAEAGLNAGLDSCDRMLVWLTPNSLASQAVIERELARGFQRFKSNPNFIIPVFAGVTPAEANARVSSALGRTLPNGRVQPPGDALPFMRLVARDVLGDHCRTIGACDAAEIRLGIHSREFTRLKPEPDFNLDWTDLFLEGKEAKPGTWEEMRLALLDVREQIAREIGRNCPLVIEGMFHISAAFLFGSLFNQPSGFRLIVRQPESGWDSASAPAGNIELQTHSVGSGDLYATEALLELAITRGVAADVDAFITRQHLSYRQRLEAELKNLQSNSRTLRISSSAEAAAVALQVRSVLEQLRAGTGRAPIHIFAALPLGVAVMIGRWTNALGPLQLYEFPNPELGYQPSLVIG